MKIKVATENDIPLLREVYLDAVTTIGPARYSPTQVLAWIKFADEPQQFWDFILSGTTFAAEMHTGAVGFCGIAEDGHVLSVYVRGSSARQGVGSALLAQVLEHSKASSASALYAEASEFSLPLFQKFGFCLVGTEHVIQYNTEFRRYRVRRDV